MLPPGRKPYGPEAGVRSDFSGFSSRRRGIRLKAQGTRRLQVIFDCLSLNPEPFLIGADRSSLRKGRALILYFARTLQGWIIFSA
jgi:hypothetical protein